MTFRTMDLSRVVPPHAVTVTFRYRLVRSSPGPLMAWLADNPEGKRAVVLRGEGGEVTLRFREPQRLYFRVADENVHLELWIVAVHILPRRVC